MIGHWPEVEDGEDLRLCECEDHDTSELGQRDAGQHLEVLKET